MTTRHCMLFAGLAAATTACASVATLRTEPLQAGPEVIYPEPFVGVVTAARRATLDSHLKVEEEAQVDSATWMVLATSHRALDGYGSVSRIVVRELGPDSVAVRIVTRKRLGTDLVSRTDWDADILLHLNRLLAERHTAPREEP